MTSDQGHGQKVKLDLERSNLSFLSETDKITQVDQNAFIPAGYGHRPKELHQNAVTYLRHTFSRFNSAKL